MADFPPLPTTNLATLCEMFPTVQRGVVEMIFEDTQGDGEKAIELLLTMSEPEPISIAAPVVEPEPCKASLSQVSATLLSPKSSSTTLSKISNDATPTSPPPLLLPVVSDLQHGHHVMVIIRGLPGSGKSSLALKLMQTTQCGLSLSTDEYFNKRGVYVFKPELLGNAHAWNQKRAMDAVNDRSNLIIIDNTNTMAWEMRPYVELAVNNNYKVHIMEPDTPWKFKPKVLAVKNTHKVPKQKIEIMLERYEKNISIEKLKIMWNISEPLNIKNAEKHEECDDEIFESEDEAVNEQRDAQVSAKTIKLNPDVTEFVPSGSRLSWQDAEASAIVLGRGSESPNSFQESEGNDVDRLVTMFPHLSLEQAATLYIQHGNNTAEVISSLLESNSPASTQEEVNNSSEVVRSASLPQAASEEAKTVPMTLDPMFAVTLQEKYGFPVDESLMQFLNTGEVLSVEIPVTMAKQIFLLWQESLQSILTTKPLLELPSPDGARAVSDCGIVGAVGIPGDSTAPKTVLAPNAVEHYEKQMLDKAMKESISQNIPKKVKPIIVVKPMKQEVTNIEQDGNTELEQFIEQRDMLYRKAMETRGSNMQGAASYYAAQARELNSHIKTTQKQSQMEMFLQANKDSPSTRLDLHYLQTSDAIKQLQQFISQKEAIARNGGTGILTVDIITGKGNRSENGKSRLRPAVQNWLEQKNYLFTEVNIGCFRVKIKSQ